MITARCPSIKVSTDLVPYGKSFFLRRGLTFRDYDAKEKEGKRDFKENGRQHIAARKGDDILARGQQATYKSDPKEVNIP